MSRIQTVLLALMVMTAAPVLAAVEEAEPAEKQSAEQQEPTLEERLDALLEETASADEYRELSNCLNRRSYRHVKVLNDEYLLFSRNQEFWLNRLKTRCVGLTRNKLLTFTTRSTGLCRGDQVYVSDRFDLDQGFDSRGRPRMHQGWCILGEFETIAPEQAMLLKELR